MARAANCASRVRACAGKFSTLHGCGGGVRHPEGSRTLIAVTKKAVGYAHMTTRRGVREQTLKGSSCGP